VKLLGRFARGGTRAPRAFILRYHRVAALRSDPNRLAIEPERFAENEALHAARWKPRPLPVLADELARDELLDGAVAVTFDDGYLDVLLTARPALERHGVPATIFLVADMLAATREFWWDELERVCFGSSGPRPALDLLVGDKRIVSDGAEPSRPQLFRRLHPLLKSLPAVERDRALARLLE
jgi:peptidoglycan/xylan/chitin deacetylase (PgdA/CDA1 family)